MRKTSEKFVIFDGTLMQGGAERVISILSHYMIEKGYPVEILLLYDREIFYDIDPRARITIVERECGTRNFFKCFIWIRKFFAEHAKIVISFLAPFNILALTAHLGLDSKIVVADRNDPRFIPSNKIVRALRDFSYRFADGVVVQTSHNKKYFSNAVQKKSAVIFNPIDLGEKAGLALKTLKKNKIVSVGRLMPQKNQKMLIDAFATVSKTYPQYELFIYGDGPERQAIEDLAKERNIADKVHMPGSVKDVFDQIADAELFVLSSNYEGMPNALIEAMCLGLPCITTNVSGAEDLIQRGVNGDIVEVDNTEELVRKMIELLGDGERRDRYAKAAIKLNQKLNTKAIMDQWLRHLGELR